MGGWVGEGAGKQAAGGRETWGHASARTGLRCGARARPPGWLRPLTPDALPHPPIHPTQYCSEVCACELPTSKPAGVAAPTAATPGTAAATEPRVQKADGGWTDRLAGTAAANEAIGRSVAPPAAADEERWDGCCAGAVRRPTQLWEDAEAAL